MYWTTYTVGLILRNIVRRCFVAALNVNREVYVFAPGQDPIKATWSPVSSQERSRVLTDVHRLC